VIRLLLAWLVGWFAGS